MSNNIWYYVVDGARVGPVDAGEIARLIDTGTVSAQTLVWRDGLDGWVAASEHFDISKGVAPVSMPPVPPQPPTQNARASGDQPNYSGAPARGFRDAINTCLNKYATFSGRASRSEYWYFVLFTVLIGFVSGLVDGIIFPGNYFSPINSIVSLAVLLPGLSVAVRRLHDIGRSGWWVGSYYLGLVAYIVLVVPIVGIAVSLSGAPAGEPSALALSVIGLGGIAFLVMTVVLLVFFCTRGEAGRNRFG